MDVTCSGCGETLTIGAPETFLFRGLPLECARCGEPLGTIGPNAEDNIGYL